MILGIPGIEESTTYQAILSEGNAQGRTEEARRIHLRMVRDRFGDPDPAVMKLIDTISDVGRLEAMTERILTATGWDNLLKAAAPPGSPAP